MKTSTLQSILARNSAAISELEESISNDKDMVAMFKSRGDHKDFFSYRYKRIAKFRKELAALVKIQRALKLEMATLVEMNRDDIAWGLVK